MTSQTPAGGPAPGPRSLPPGYQCSPTRLCTIPVRQPRCSHICSGEGDLRRAACRGERGQMALSSAGKESKLKTLRAENPELWPPFPREGRLSAPMTRAGQGGSTGQQSLRGCSPGSERTKYLEAWGARVIRAGDRCVPAKAGWLGGAACPHAPLCPPRPQKPHCRGPRERERRPRTWLGYGDAAGCPRGGLLPTLSLSFPPCKTQGLPEPPRFDSHFCSALHLLQMKEPGPRGSPGLAGGGGGAGQKRQGFVRGDRRR